MARITALTVNWNGADDTLAWEQIDDRWTHVPRINTVETHLEHQEHAEKRASVGRR